MYIDTLMSVETEELEEIAVKDKSAEVNELILFNDDYNTFDFVIECLIEICEHSPQQAEQCTWIVHYKGKCSVKKGTFDELKPKADQLLNRGLTVEIE